jgi:hypothetical protein
MLSASEAIELAAEHAKRLGASDAHTSAQVALAEARAFAGAGQLHNASLQALESLRHSVGVLHPDFERVSRYLRVHRPRARRGRIHVW